MSAFTAVTDPEILAKVQNSLVSSQADLTKSTEVTDPELFLKIQEQLKNVSKLVVSEGYFSEVFNYENSKEILESRNRWRKVLQSDFQLNEGLKVLDNGDEKMFTLVSCYKIV